MKRTVLVTAAAAIAAVPAILGVAAHATANQPTLTMAPAAATVVTTAEPGDDSSTRSSSTPTASPTSHAMTETHRSTSTHEANHRSTHSSIHATDDHGRGTEIGNDSGGHGGHGRKGNSGKG
ncbi:MAG: hypothetical protein IPG94_11755 [Kineosporiaceae bacterium]|nr:hypothetical protein [Kineosporiaceae bacterium]